MTKRAAHTVLIVDDDTYLLDALRRVYQREPYNLLLARDVGTARRLLGEFRVDVLVSDHRMPGTSGVEFLAEVRVTHPDVISMMLTGEADSEIAARAINAGGVHRFFTKPCDAGRLALEIRAVLQQKALVRQARQLLDGVRSPAAGPVAGGDDPAPTPIEIEDGPSDLMTLLGELESASGVAPPAGARPERG